MQPRTVTIRAAGLAKKYRSGNGELVVFADLDLEVYEGERLAIVGESGAGKTTLLQLLGGVDRPTEGAIYFKSRDVSSLSDSGLADYRNKEVGFVWQIQSLLPEFTALENVMMPLLIRGDSPSQASSTAVARLEEVGLLPRAAHHAGELSGGEQQRVALARALVGNPSLLLADEPTGNLDHRTGERIIELLARMHRSRGLTSISVTHNLAFAARCDRALRLEGGRLAPLAGDPRGTAATKTDGGDYV